MEAMVRDGLRWLEGIEDGTLGTADLYILSQKMDPVLIHLIIKFLRKKYPSIKPEAAAVMARLVDLTSNYPEIVKHMKDAESDPFPSGLPIPIISGNSIRNLRKCLSSSWRNSRAET